MSVKLDRKSIKIYEMLLRDGLQSLKQVYSLEDKVLIYKLIEETGLSNIEFGSMTSEKILPQMSKSLELHELISKQKRPNTNLIMLCPSIRGLEKILLSGIKQISLLCSASEQFSYKNLNCDKNISINTMFTQLGLITNNNFELIRIYVSCTFGSPWDNFDVEYLNKLIGLINQIYEFVKLNSIRHENFDIVLSDTFGLGTEEKLSELYKCLKERLGTNIFNYLALHLHTCQIKVNNNIGDNIFVSNKSIGFEKLILISLDYGIKKYDSSLLGIGGCPFGEDNLKGNLSTQDLINFLESNDYDININKEKLLNNSFQINKILSKQ